MPFLLGPSTILLVLAAAPPRDSGDIFHATLGETGARTAEVSTQELREILAARSATVFDSRPHLEYAMGHIPGAVNVAAKPGVEMAKYVSDVAEISRVLGNRKDAPVVLYCNGPFCEKSKRLSDELLAAGHTNVRRYQLGMPVWRALGGIAQIERDGAAVVARGDRTAVWIDVRAAEEFSKGSVAGARSVPRALVVAGKDSSELKKAKNDGRLPMTDHNTRIIVFGASPDDARFVTEQLAREAFHNVSFFAGTWAELQEATGSMASK
ncbi:MAG: sulfur transferase [Deltaproteobacteria bacterium]|nr:MAG: sulfur transferase [Deltaproteobacteria bacterium]